MVICFGCTIQLKEKLDQLLLKGGYEDYAAAISAAVDNLLILEQQVARSGSVILGEAPPAKPSAPASVPPRVVDGNDSAPPDSSGAPGAMEPFEVVSFASSPMLAEMVTVDSDGVIAPDRWIFGQYNKFLPVKANCRLIAQMLHRSPSGVALQAIAEAVQQHMPQLRQWLSEYDSRHELERETALATAFPTKDSKSLLRYMNQFVMSVNKGGVVSGLPVVLGFLNRLDAKGTRVSLTQAGLRFALLPSPVLDSPRQPEQRFSMRETRFLLDHIRAAVPREHAAYTSVLRAIERGASSPEALDAALRPLVNEAGASISDPYLSTQRSGAISRLTELGLVARQREGIRVTYSVTQEGRAYINDEERAVA
jgi:DNA-binding transcriptional ArsR family regulator